MVVVLVGPLWLWAVWLIVRQMVWLGHPRWRARWPWVPQRIWSAFEILDGPGVWRAFARSAAILLVIRAGAALVMVLCSDLYAPGLDLLCVYLLQVVLVPEWGVLPVWWCSPGLLAGFIGVVLVCIDCLPAAAIIASFSARSRTSLMLGLTGSILVASPAAVFLLSPHVKLLSGTDLRGRDLQSAQFDETDLRGAKLDGADLTGSATSPISRTFAASGTHEACARLLWRDFSSADMVGADLRGADLRWSFLCGARFAGASLRRVHAPSSELTGLSMVGVDLTGANLRRADLEGCDLRDACLDGADLTGTNFSGCKLGHARLTRLRAVSANFYDANLRQANLEASDLRRASLEGANLSYANLHGTNLAGAYCGGMVDFRGANLAGADLRTSDSRGVLVGVGHLLLTGATYDGKTQLPPGIDLGNFGAVRRQ